MGYNGQTTYVIMCIYIIMYIYTYILIGLFHACTQVPVHSRYLPGGSDAATRRLRLATRGSLAGHCGSGGCVEVMWFGTFMTGMGMGQNVNVAIFWQVFKKTRCFQYYVG